MKCRVCGCEFDSDRTHCPMCGSKAQEEINNKNSEEFFWNTYDFPKPRSVGNIAMSWPSMSSEKKEPVTIMSRDASEGYFSSEMSWNSPAASAEQNRPPQPTPEMVWNKPVQPAPAPQPVYQQPAQPAAPVQQAPVQSAPVQQPQPAPAVQFSSASWQMPNMRPEPSWTPYNVQPQQINTQVPQTTPLYVPQFPQPAQTAWTIPQQPGQPVYVAQPAQPVYIQQAPQQPSVQPGQPVYQQPPQPAAMPIYMTQPVPSQQVPLQPAPAPVQQAPVQPAVQPMQTVQPVQQAAVQPAQPVYQPAPVHPEPPKAPQQSFAPAKEEKDHLLDENIVAGAGKPSETPKYEEHHVYEPDETGRYPEKFFTFNKKNEEFQQLLDREYERLRGIKGEAPARDLDSTAIYSKGSMSAQQTAAQNFFGASPEASDMSEFEEMLMSGTTDSSEGNTLKIRQEKIKKAAEFMAEQEPLGQPKAPAAEAPAEDTRSERQKKLDAMAAAREAYFSKLLNDMDGPDSDSFKSEMAAKSAASAERRTVSTKTAPIQPKDFVWTTSFDKPQVSDANKDEYKPEASAPMQSEGDKADLEEIVRTGAASESAAAEADKAIPAESAGPSAADASKASEAQSQDQPEENSKPAESAGNSGKSALSDKESSLEEVLDKADEEKERIEAKKEKKHGVLKVFLILVIILALAEGGTIGLKMFAPDLEITKTMAGIEKTVFDFFGGLFSKTEEEQPLEDPNANADTSYNFQEVVDSVNTNIDSVASNLNLGYNSEIKCDAPGLAKSILVEDGAEKALICKTLVAYNSSWIDYVQGKDTKCLDYLKADGPAYRGAVSYDKIGRVQEDFKLLEVGEMRKNGDTYYVFSREAISVTETLEDGTAKSGDSVSTSVYEMLKVGEDLKIVSYYPVE